jgi:hypothetical protein
MEGDIHAPFFFVYCDCSGFFFILFWIESCGLAGNVAVFSMNEQTGYDDEKRGRKKIVVTDFVLSFLIPLR